MKSIIIVLTIILFATLFMGVIHANSPKLLKLSNPVKKMALVKLARVDDSSKDENIDTSGSNLKTSLTELNDIQSFTNELLSDSRVRLVGISNFDLNRDGVEDKLVFYNRRKQAHLTVLLHTPDSYQKITFPNYDGYQIQPNGEIRAMVGTYPVRSIQGSDLHPWYDFYKIENGRLKLTNLKHATFYRKVSILYQIRINELRKEIKSNNKLLRKKRDGIIGMANLLKKDHVQRYKIFIKRVWTLLKGRDYTE